MSFIRKFFGGKEFPDPTPVAVPLKFRSGPGDDLHRRINETVRGIMWKEKSDKEGFDSFEESMDFDVDDPDDMPTKYELFDAHQDALRNAMIDKRELKEENALRERFVRAKFKGDDDGKGKGRQQDRRDSRPSSGDDESDTNRHRSRRSRTDERSDQTTDYEREEPSDRGHSSRRTRGD